MFHRAIPAGLLGLATPLTLGAQTPWTADGVRLAQLTIHERIVIRVPRMTTTPPVPVEWKERKGPKCVAVTDVGGALVKGGDAVDLVLIGNHRIRARLERGCHQLGYYSGFYIKPGADGMVCAGRDSIRVRSGAACGISTFRRLEPRR